MSFPLLATRLLARSVFPASKLVLRHTPSNSITRSFSVSSAVWARAAAAAETKAPAKKAQAKKKTVKKVVKKTVKKPVGKNKKAKKSLRPAKKPKKKVVKKKEVERIRITPQDLPPKRPPTVFSFFISHTIKSTQIPAGTKPTEFIGNKGKEAAITWKSLSDQEKQPYVEQAAAAKAEYLRKVEEYAKNADPKIIREINKRRANKGKRKIRVKVGPSTANGYILFTKEGRKNKPIPANRDEAIELFKEFGREWSALSDEAKQNYKERAASIKAETKQS